jgi:hypothetical protein
MEKEARFARGRSAVGGWREQGVITDSEFVGAQCASEQHKEMPVAKATLLFRMYLGADVNEYEFMIELETCPQRLKPQIKLSMLRHG